MSASDVPSSFGAAGGPSEAAVHLHEDHLSTPAGAALPPAHIAETVRRTWRFWCEGCGPSAVEFRSFEDRDVEREVTLWWVKEHHGHGLGGFVTPTTTGHRPEAWNAT